MDMNSITALSDRVIEALGTDAPDVLGDVEKALGSSYLRTLAEAPATTVRAILGDGKHLSEISAFTLGIIGMAHAIVSREASKRIDRRIGATEVRLEGDELLNYLTPAAQALDRHDATMRTGNLALARLTVADALSVQRQKLPPHLRQVLSWIPWENESAAETVRS